MRNKWGVKRRKDEFTVEDYEKGKHKLNVTHEEFIRECEQIIRPYRRISSQLSEWILAYFLCNAASFTFFLLVRLFVIVNHTTHK